MSLFLIQSSKPKWQSVPLGISLHKQPLWIWFWYQSKHVSRNIGEIIFPKENQSINNRRKDRWTDALELNHLNLKSTNSSLLNYSKWYVVHISNTFRGSDIRSTLTFNLLFFMLVPFSSSSVWLPKMAQHFWDSNHQFSHIWPEGDISMENLNSDLIEPPWASYMLIGLGMVLVNQSCGKEAGIILLSFPLSLGMVSSSLRHMDDLGGGWAWPTLRLLHGRGMGGQRLGGHGKYLQKPPWNPHLSKE